MVRRVVERSMARVLTWLRALEDRELIDTTMAGAHASNDRRSS